MKAQGFTISESRTVGDRLRIIRKRLALSQVEAATEYGTTRNTIIAYETPTSPPSRIPIHYISWLAQKSGVDLNWLISNDSPVPKTLAAQWEHLLGGAMDERGLSYSEMSRLVFGNDKQTAMILRVVLGKTAPSLSTVDKFARAMGCTLELRMIPIGSGPRSN